MKKILKTGLLTLLLSFGFLCTPTMAEGEGVIKQATRQCEKEVTENCIAHLCPLYCGILNSERRNSDQLTSQCKNECTSEKRCKIKPLGGMDDPKNRELDAQTREQLIQCIAEVRDPNGTKSGRRMTSWKEIETPSWAKLLDKLTPSK